ncbi:MAG: antitoxin [Propionibacteriaceae bacterium]|nr:antitoxin [Propionibacteriaceae bacterium]
MRTSLFYSNTTQAVRLPKAVAFPDDVTEVEIRVVGNTRVIAPADQSWDDWFAREDISSDFMAERDQPPDQERDWS